MDNEILNELKLLNSKIDKLIGVMEKNKFENARQAVSAPGLPGMPSFNQTGLPFPGASMKAPTPGANFTANSGVDPEAMRAQIEERIKAARQEAELKKQEIEKQAGPQSKVIP